MGTYGYMKTDVYGYVNGKKAYSRDEYIEMCRGFADLHGDDELLEYAQKVTHDWYNAGWHRTFTSYYLSDYALEEPYRSLKKHEFERLKELQAEARAAEKAADDAREWRFIQSCYYADNSVEEVWEDKDGNRKIVMTTAPHGDAC